MLFFASLVVLVAFFIRKESDPRVSVGRASLWWAASAIVWVECLSAANAIEPLQIATLWMAVLAWTTWRIAHGEQLSNTLQLVRKTAADHRLLAFTLMLFVVGTFVVAFVSAPNNWDSLTYHLPKVEEWLQNRSLALYPTSVSRQVALNPGAEILVLHARALAGSDALVNLVQFTCYLVSIASASVVAGRLGASSRGQWYAALYVTTAPMVVLQASTTQNDLVIGCWVLLLVERLLAFRERAGFVVALEIGLALGLGLVTKGTAMVVMFPFGCFLLLLLWRHGLKRSMAYASLVAVPVLLLNSPWWWRNYTAFHNPLGPISEIVLNKRHGVDVVWSNMVRNLTSEFLTPFHEIDRRLYGLSISVLHATRVNPEDLQTTVGAYHSTLNVVAPWHMTHEDFAANPVHVALALLSVMQVAWIAATACRDKHSRDVVVFTGAVLIGALMYCLVLRWQVWAARLHVPLLLLAAPIVGERMGRWRAWTGMTAGTIMTVAAVPALLFNATRPLFSWPPDIVPLWSKSRVEVMFANNPDVRSSYVAAADLIARRPPVEVGLLLQNGSFEYPLWYLLHERGLSPRMTHLNDVVGIRHPVRPPWPDVIVAIDVDPSTSADLVRVQTEQRCAFDVSGRWGTVVVLERACGSNSVGNR